MRKLALALGLGAAAGLIAPSASAATVTQAGPGQRAGAAHRGLTVRSHPYPAPAAIDPSASTNVTFTVGPGALTITAPVAVTLGSGFPNTVIGPTAMGEVHVDDTRGVANAGWITTVNGPANFTGSPSGTIPISAAAYVTGIVDTTNIPSLSKFNVTLSATPQNIVVASGAPGGNHASWNPTLTVTVPLAAVAGDYSAAIVHSVTATP